MRRLKLILLVSFLLATLTFVQKGNILVANASSSIFQGDLILNGNNVTIIENERFDINGSVIVEENATLVLRNAVLNFTQSAMYEHNMTLRNPANGNPRLQCNNSMITSNLNYFLVQLYDNSSANISNSADTDYLRLFGSAVVSISNSSIGVFEAYDYAVVSIFNSTFEFAYASYTSTLTASNSTIHLLSIESTTVNCSLANIRPGFFNHWDYKSNSSLLIGSGGSAPNVTLSNTAVESWQLEFDGASNVTIKDSTLHVLLSYYSTTVWLANTTVTITQFFLQGKVYFSWYLNAQVVDSVSQDVPSANVTAFYPNSTLADSKFTDTSGRATLTLMEKMMNATGSYPVGNYTVQASHLVYSNYTTVNITQSQEITLALSDFVIPEFPLFLMPLFTIATLLAVILHQKKKERS